MNGLCEKIILGRYTFLLLLGMLSMSTSWGQDGEWDVHKMDRENALRQAALDSILNHLESKWEIKLSYGNWYFLNGSKTTEEDVFFLPDQMTSWQLATSWHIRESFALALSVGFQQSREMDGNIDIGAVLSGDDIEIEGYGAGFFPIDLGGKYYFLQNRFRPYLGLSGGAVLIQGQYTVAEGNIVDGSNRTDTPVSDRALFGKLSTGFDYRLGEYTSINGNVSYYLSTNFQELVGGYTAYGGVHLSVGFAVIF